MKGASPDCADAEIMELEEYTKQSKERLIIITKNCNKCNIYIYIYITQEHTKKQELNNRESKNKKKDN